MKVKTRHANITIKFNDLTTLRESMDKIFTMIRGHGIDHFKTENFQYEIKTDESDLIDWREEIINGQLCWVIPSKINKE